MYPSLGFPLAEVFFCELSTIVSSITVECGDGDDVIMGLFYSMKQIFGGAGGNYNLGT